MDSYESKQTLASQLVTIPEYSISGYNFPLEVEDVVDAFTSGETLTATRDREASYLQSRPSATLDDKQLVCICDTIAWKVLCK